MYNMQIFVSAQALLFLFSLAENIKLNTNVSDCLENFFHLKIENIIVTSIFHYIVDSGT